MLGLYIVGAWIAFQVVQTLTEGLGLPDWFPALAAVLLIVFLPVVLATAFIQEGLGAKGAAPPATPAVTAEPIAGRPPAGARRVLTWRNALLGGAGAFALLGIGTSGYMAMRLMGIGPPGTLIAKGVLEERERIALAELEETTGDSTLAAAVTEMLRVDLSQSPIVRVAEADFVAVALERMERERGTSLDYELARELALREGLRAVIAGELHPVGSGYVISARLVLAETGEELWTDRVNAADENEVIPAVERLSKSLRDRVGENLSSIRRSHRLEKVTTPSLDALRRYSEAIRSSPREQNLALSLLHEAITFDSGFAMAYMALHRRQIWRSPAAGLESLAAAFRLRERLTDEERYYIEGLYFTRSAQYEKAIAAFRTLLGISPDHSRARYFLGWVYENLGDHTRAEELYRVGIEMDSLGPELYHTLAVAQIAQGKFPEARATLDRAAEKFADHPSLLRDAAYLANCAGDYETAASYARALLEVAEWRTLANDLLANLSALRGRLREASQHRREAQVFALSEEKSPRLYLVEASRIARDEAIRGKPGQGLVELEAALERYPLDSLLPLDRPSAQLAEAHVRLGLVPQARAMLAAYESAVDSVLSRYGLEAWRVWHITDFDPRHRVRGMIALAEDRPTEALAAFREWERRPGGACRTCVLAYVAQAYDALSQADSALLKYERYATETSAFRIFEDWQTLPSVYERLGDLYEQRGDKAKAIHYYGKLVELWKDADPELQPRVEAARRAIEALSPDT